MGHGLEKSGKGGKYEYIAFKKLGWHGLGNPFQEKIGTREGYELAGLTWQVKKSPNFQIIFDADGNELRRVESETSFFTYRDDTLQILGDRIGKNYQVLQHTDAFDIIDDVLAVGGYHLETMGALFGGKIVFACVKLNQSLFIDQKERTDLYALFTFNHVGNVASYAVLSPVRVVCNNTMQMAIANCVEKLPIYHTGNPVEKVETAVKMVESFTRQAAVLERAIYELSDQKLTEGGLLNLIGNVFFDDREIKKIVENGVEEIGVRKRKELAAVYDYAMTGPGQDGSKNLYTGYHAVTGYFGNAKAYLNAEDRMNNLFYKGTAKARMERAAAIVNNPGSMIDVAKTIRVAIDNQN